MFSRLACFVFTIINWLTPKHSNKVLFCCFPDFDDMLRGMLPYVNESVVVLVKNETDIRPSWLPYEIRVVKKRSFSGVFHIITSKKIYYTHGLYSFFKPLNIKRQYVVNLWHGMALKNIGRLDGKKSVPKAHRTLCTSPLFKEIHAKAFEMNINDVLISGLPRNDILLMKTKNQVLMNIKSKYDKCYVWLPTYRKSSFGDVRVDGESSSIFGFDDFDYLKLNEMLKSKNQLLLIKPHPMAKLANFNVKLSNVIVIQEDWLTEKNLSLYELLSISDSLWTDYSSVFVDYLIVKKPILFIVPDKENYKANRGFTFDTQKYPLPGTEITTQESLFSIIDKGIKPINIDSAIFNTVSKFKYEMLKNYE